MGTIASFEFPETHLKTGENIVVVNVNMTVLNNTGCGDFTCFNVFQTYAGMVGVPGFGVNAAFISLEGDDMKVKSLGMTVKGSYSQTFRMNCKVIGDGSPAEPLNVTDEPACKAIKAEGGCTAPSM